MTETAAPGRTSSFYTYYVVFLMAGVYFMSFVDRQIIAILMPKIQADFGFDDNAMGFLVGPAFGFLYAFLAMPFAMLGDRFSRRNIVVFCVALYSAATLIGGYVSQVWQLAATRVGVGAGQAGPTPSVNSILADIVPPKDRAFAMSMGAAGGKLGIIAATFGGGLIAAEYGWRTAMIVAGIPGLILAALLLFTVKEPARGVSEARKDSGKAPPFFQTLKILFAIRSFTFIILGMMPVVIVSANMIIFMPSFFTRSHHLSLVDVSIITASFTAIGVISTSLAGVVADRLSRKNPRWMLYVPALLQLICVPFYPFLLLVNDLTAVIFIAIVPMLMGGGAYTGPIFAALQNIAPLRVRAMATGVLLFISGVFGSIIGPQLVGSISQLLAEEFGRDSLRYSMLIVFLPCLLIGGALFWSAARTLEADTTRAREQG